MAEKEEDANTTSTTDSGQVTSARIRISRRKAAAIRSVNE